MTMKAIRNILQASALLGVLVIQSCAAPNGPDAPADGIVNHPITVAPAFRTVDIAYNGAYAPLSSDDQARLDNFVQDYMARGNGAISVSAPAGPGSSEAIAYFGERLAALGVSRGRILVGSRDAAPNDNRVEFSYMGYVARTVPCGDWSQDATDTETNLPMPNFGCSVQQNIAAMVSDPRDLTGPRPMGTADAARRATVVGNYEKGTPTSATKTSDQTAAIASVGSGTP
jgi:pilus assembly protein CpaD